MKSIAPHVCISEDGGELTLEWWEGERSLCCWFDAEGEDVYHGIERGAGDGEMRYHDFPSLRAAYVWLVSGAVVAQEARSRKLSPAASQRPTAPHSASGEARAVLDAAMSEAEWQAQVVGCAERHGWWVYHNPDSRRSTAGYPDLTCVHPVRGVTIFAELKAEGGRLSHEQERWRDALVLSGQRWYLWRPSDFEAVERVLKGEGE